MNRLLISLLVITFNLSAIDTLPYKESPIAPLDQLIDATETLVKKQKNLRKTLEEYLILRDEYLKDTENRGNLAKAATAAKQALDMIKEQRLTYIFDASLISEMTLFAKLATKPTIKPTP